MHRPGDHVNTPRKGCSCSGCRNLYQIRRLRARYGISQQGLLALIEGQGNLCKICGKELAPYTVRDRRGGFTHIDHIPGTKIVRGILCSTCNRGLGKLLEDRTVIASAIEYVRKKPMDVNGSPPEPRSIHGNPKRKTPIVGCDCAQCKGVRRETALWKRYGLSTQTFATLVIAQDGRCPICGNTLRPYGSEIGGTGWTHVDHIPGTRGIRGILCINCNQGIGSFRHDPELLQRAHDYLF